MPSAFDNDAPPSDPPPPPNPQRDTNRLQMPSLASPSRAAAIVSRIGSAVAEVFRAFSPPRIFPSDLIGASPFVQSHVDSTMSATMDDMVSCGETWAGAWSDTRHRYHAETFVQKKASRRNSNIGNPTYDINQNIWQTQLPIPCLQCPYWEMSNSG